MSETTATGGRVEWVKTDEGHDGFVGGNNSRDGISNPDFLIVRESHRMHLYQAGYETAVFVGTLKKCQQHAEKLAALAEGDLPPSEEASDAFDQAEEAPARKYETLAWPMQGVEDGRGATGVPYLRWKSECGRYRVTRINHAAEQKVVYGGEAFDYDANRFTPLENEKGNYVKYYKNLRTAVEACEEDLLKENGLPVRGNREDFLVANREARPVGVVVIEDSDDDDVDGDAIIQGVARETQEQDYEEGGGVVKVKEDKVREMFLALGADQRAKDPLKKLQAKLAELPRWASKLKEPEEESAKRLFRRLMKCAEGGETIEVVPADVPAVAANGAVAAGKTKPGKADKGGAKPTKAKPAKEDGPKKDAPAKAKPAKGQEGDKQPSTKERVYRLWAKDKEAKPEECLEAVGDSVKLTTVRSWMSAWGRGNNLPACAKAK